MDWPRPSLRRDGRCLMKESDSLRWERQAGGSLRMTVELSDLQQVMR